MLAAATRRGEPDERARAWELLVECAAGSGSAAGRLRPGDTVWLRHAKAGEPAEHLNHVWVYSEGKISGQWPTYRGEGKAFL